MCLSELEVLDRRLQNTFFWKVLTFSPTPGQLSFQVELSLGVNDPVQAEKLPFVFKGMLTVAKEWNHSSGKKANCGKFYGSLRKDPFLTHFLCSV